MTTNTSVTPSGSEVNTPGPSLSPGSAGSASPQVRATLQQIPGNHRDLTPGAFQQPADGAQQSPPLHSMFTMFSALNGLTPEQQEAVASFAVHIANERVGPLSLAGAPSALATTAQVHTVSPTAAAPARGIITEADEVDVSAFNRPVDIPRELEDLWKYRIYAPIHLFTCKNLQLIVTEGGNLLKNISFSNMPTVPLLDVNHASFGKETDLTVVPWTEAWANYSRYISLHFDEAVYTRWRRHFEALATRSNSEAMFPAILAFDIAQRRAYNNAPFKHNQGRWDTDLLMYMTQFHHDEMSKRIDSGRPSRANTFPARSNTIGASRFTPYDRERQKPFPSSKPRAASGPCIICGWPGHFARDCVARVTTWKRPVLSKVVQGRSDALKNIKDDKLFFCLSFNVGGPGKCVKPGIHPTSVKHACSICGESSHHAAVCSGPP